MNRIEKLFGVIALISVLSAACQRGPHKETWGAGKPKKTLEKKK